MKQLSKEQQKQIYKNLLQQQKKTSLRTYQKSW